jgi:arabinose-5-phosphate isomerase
MENNKINNDKVIQIAKKVFDIEVDSILKTKDKLDNSFTDIINILFHCKGKVIVTGIGKTGIIGRKLAASLSSTGTPSLFLNAAEASHGDSGVITHSDVVLMISNSGSSKELLDLIPTINKIKSIIILITGNIKSKLASFSNYVIEIKVDKEACPLNLAPTSSTTTILVVCDAIVVTLLKIRGFNQENFALYHPKGTLGMRLLTRVSDLMKTIDSVGIVDRYSSLLHLVKVLTKFNNGIILVQENNFIIGVITDGDIRRALSTCTDFLKLKANEIMTRNFHKIELSELAINALEMMEKFKISALPVYNQETPVGLVRLLDIYDKGLK